MNKSISSLALLLAAGLLVPEARAGEEKLSTEEASALLGSVANRLVLGGADAGPFRIRGAIRFLFDDAAPQGQLAVSWASPVRHRFEWALPGWRELRLQDGAEVHVWRGPENDPRLGIMSALLQEALFPARLLSVRLDEKGRPLVEGRRLRVDGRALVEIRLAGTKDGPRVWIDEAGPELVAFEDELRRFDFAGSETAGGRSWPRSVRLIRQGRELLGLSLSEPVHGSEHVPDELFEVPEGAQALATELSSGMRRPRLLHAPQPHYPLKDRKAQIEGTVVAELRIGTDGSVKDVTLLAGLSPSLNAAALESLAGRRYEPARLGDRPVECLSTVRFGFKLEGSSGVRVFRRRSSGAG